MSLAEQLRAIADRLEAADSERRSALDECLRLLATEWVDDHNASVLVADEERASGEALGTVTSPAAPDAGVVQVATTPARHAGDAGSTPATRSNVCPECGKQTPTAAGLVTHRSRMHGVKPPVGGHRTAAERLEARKKVPTNGVGYSAPVGKAAIPPTPVIRNGKEFWLCARCPRDFTSAEALKGHMMKGHPPAAVATRPFGEQPVMERSGGGFRD